MRLRGFHCGGTIEPCSNKVSVPLRRLDTTP
jgi:hypothetical protein